MDVINRTRNHLENVSTGQSDGRLDIQLLERASSKFALDASAEVHSETVVRSILTPLMNILMHPTGLRAEDEETAESYFYTITKLLEALFSHQSFSDTLKFIPVELLVQGIQSRDPLFKRVCINQVTARVEPSDLIASTVFVEELAKVLADRDIDSTVVSTTTKGLVKLCTDGQLVRRRLFTSPECVAQLKLCHDDWDKGVLQGRLMTLLEGVLPHDHEHSIPLSLIQYPASTIDSEDADILLVLNKIVFYKNLFVQDHLPSLATDLTEQLTAIGSLFSHRDSNPMVQSFLLAELYDFFGVLSRNEPELFTLLDDAFNITSVSDRETELLMLSTIDPEYLLTRVPALISGLSCQTAHIRALQNILLNKAAYELTQLSADRIMALPVLPRVVLLRTVTSTPWGIDDLVINWPSVMSWMIDRGTDVRDRDVLSFLHQVFDNLLTQSSEVLAVWDAPLRSRYRQLFLGSEGSEGPSVMVDQGTA